MAIDVDCRGTAIGGKFCGTYLCCVMAKFVFISIGKILVNQVYASQSNCQVKIVVLVVHDYIMIMSGLSIRPRSQRPVHDTRSNIPSNSGQRTFYYRIISIWNNLDNTLKTFKLISSFKSYLKNK